MSLSVKLFFTLQKLQILREEQKIYVQKNSFPSLISLIALDVIRRR